MKIQIRYRRCGQWWQLYCPCCGWIYYAERWSALIRQADDHAREVHPK